MLPTYKLRYNYIDSLYCSVHLREGIEHCFCYKRQLKNYYYHYYYYYYCYYYYIYIIYICIYIYIYKYIYGENLNALVSPGGFFRVNVSNLQFVWNQTNLASFTTLSVTCLLFKGFLLRSSVYPLVKSLLSRCSKSLNNLSPTIFKTWFSFSSDQRNSETWNL